MTGDRGRDVASWIAPLRDDPSRTALLFDFDGTLSPTVADPTAARLADGFEPMLAQLADRYRTVALVSGRPISFLAPMAPPGVVLSGQYGLERRDRDGVVHTHPGAAGVDIGAAVAALRALGVDAAALEPKGLSLTVHYRTRPAEEPLIRASVAEVAVARGLVVHDAKQSVELRAPVEVDKGTVVRDLAEGAAGVLYVGDDLGDLPAFAELAALRAAGATTVAIAVAGPEAPPALMNAADATVAGVGGVADLLRSLVTPGS